jgi:hypothetical protein
VTLETEVAWDPTPLRLRPEVLGRKIQLILRRLDQRLDAMSGAGQNLGDRVTAVEQVMYRAAVVPSLPASAPAGYLLVTGGDTNLYIGTGPANPLRKLPTQVV